MRRINADFDIAYNMANKLIDKFKSSKNNLKKFADKYLNLMLGDDK